MTAPPAPGLCAECAFHRVVENARGSRFWLCERSRFDARFPRYPQLPVLACAGYRPARDPAAPGRAGTRPDVLADDPAAPRGPSTERPTGQEDP